VIHLKLKKMMTGDEVSAYLEAKYGPMSPEAQEKLDAHIAATAAELEILNLLRDLREKAKLTQGQLAAMSSVPQPEISRFEAGKGNPTLATLAKISSALGYRLTLTQK
jgi:DNA-binding XRE family transcriptional regulator